MPTPHDTARTWRDIADTLTDEQIESLQRWERDPVPGPGDNEASQLRMAREFAGSNAAAAFYADVAPPPDAQQVDDWTIGLWSDDGYTRGFRGASRAVDDGIVVKVAGVQHVDGSAERGVVVELRDDWLTAALARRLGEALIATADEVDAAVTGIHR
jgi:hypothetical protein